MLRPFHRRGATFAVLTLCLAWIAMGLTQCTRRIAAPQNIILITLDTTRADALGVYGNGQAQTPVIDALAGNGHHFTQCYSQAPITLPSHSSILTGLIPPNHGVRNNGSYRLGEVPTLAQALRASGMRTGAFVGSAILLEEFGLGRGFDHYDDEIVHYTESRETGHIVTRRAESVIQRAWSWISDRDQPFFSWIHLYDPHWPYEPPSPFAEAFADNPYLGELAYVDLQLGWLVDQLRRKGLFENTLIVITADHGESFGEHGEQSHGFFCYGATTHVPLILSQPIMGEAGQSFDHLVRSIDIAPTLLRLKGLKPKTALDGLPLWDKGPRESYSEAMIPYENFYCAPVQAYRDQQLSYYKGNAEELYDIAADPRENNNLIESDPERAARLRDGLAPLLRETGENDSERQMDPSTVELLRSLGYVHDGGSHIPGTKAPHELPPPKEALPVYRVFQRLNHQGKTYPFKAIEAYTRLETEFPDNVVVQKELGRLLTFAGDRDGALRRLRKAAETRHEDPRLHTLLGLGHAHFGEREEALDEFRLALELDPNHLIARYNAAVLFL